MTLDDLAKKTGIAIYRLTEIAETSNASLTEALQISECIGKSVNSIFWVTEKNQVALDIADLAKLGYSAKDIAVKLSLKKSYVYQITHKQGIKLARGNRENSVMITRLKSAAERGLTQKEAAKECNVSSGVVSGYAKRHEIKFKTQRQVAKRAVNSGSFVAKHPVSEYQRLASLGLTAPQAAKILNVNTQTVYYAAKKHNIAFVSAYTKKGENV